MKRYAVPPGVQARDLIAMTVHDLRTPVTAIKGFSQLALRKKDLPPEVRPYLDLIVAETNRVSSLIDDLVLLGRLEQGEEAVHLAPDDLTDRLAAVAATLGRAGLAGRIAVEPDLPSLVACCDPALTERALANLVRYAIKFAAEDEPVVLGAVRTPRGPTITVRTGPLPNGALSETQPDGATAEEMASDEWGPRGLGTYISGKLIEIQSGELWMDSVGGGVRFQVILSDGRANRSLAIGGDQRWS